MEIYLYARKISFYSRVSRKILKNQLRNILIFKVINMVDFQIKNLQRIFVCLKLKLFQ